MPLILFGSQVAKCVMIRQYIISVSASSMFCNPSSKARAITKQIIMQNSTMLSKQGLANKTKHWARGTNREHPTI